MAAGMLTAVSSVLDCGAGAALGAAGMTGGLAAATAVATIDH